MKSLYSKFMVVTLIIMFGSATLGFLLANTYYQKQLKGQNDSKNVGVAEGMAAYYAEIVELESGRLSVLTKRLLVLTTLDHPSYHPDFKRVSIKEQMERAIRQNEWRFEKHNLDVRMDLPKLVTQGDPDTLMQVWENIVTNAVKYNQPNGTIQINGYEWESELHITVKDSGIGMTAAQAEKAFDRFFRADLSRSRGREGTGLGLAIVREAVKKHDGMVEINSSFGKGTTIHITLPKL